MRMWEDVAQARERRSDAVAMWLLVLVVGFTGWVFGEAHGRALEAQLTLDAFAVAHEANYLLAMSNEHVAGRLGVAERAVRVCLFREDARAHELLEARTSQRWPDRDLLAEGS